MSLRSKTLIAIGSLFVVLLGVLFAVMRGVLFSEMRMQEEKALRKVIGQYRSFLRSDEKTLAQRAADWAGWDDTYQFMVDRNKGFIERNLNDDTFDTAGIEFIALLDTAGRMVFQKFYDAELKKTITPGPEMLSAISALAKSVDQEQLNSYRGGLVPAADSVMLVVARPIVTSSYEGPSHGIFCIGLKVTESHLKDFDALTNGKSKLADFTGAGISRDLRAQLLKADDNEVCVKAQAELITAYALLPDAFGKDGILLMVTQPRVLIKRGYELERVILIGLCSMTLLFGVLMLAVLELTVLKPLSMLNWNVQEIGLKGDPAQHLTIAGSDELSQLARSINSMLYAIGEAQLEREEGERRYEFQYHNTPVMLQSFNEEVVLISVSNYWLEKLGYQREEVIGQKATVFMTESSRRYAESVVLPSFFATGVARDIPIQLVRKDGSIIDVLLSAIAERDANGRFVRSLSVLVDVTERKRAEEQILRRASEIHAITEAFPDLYFRIDKQGNYLEFLGSRKDLYVQPEDFIGKNHRDVLPGDIADLFDSAIRRTVASGKLVSLEYTMPLNGKIQSFEARMLPLAQDQLLTVVRNITDRKRAELWQEILLRINEAVLSAENLHSLLRTVQRQLGRMINTANFYVAMYDAAGEMYEFPYFVDERDTGFEAQRMEHSLTDYVRRTGKPLLASADVTQRLMDSGEVLPFGPLSPSWIGAPLNTAQGTLGVVVVQSYDEANLYSESDLEVLALVSSDIAMAIERKRAQECLAASEERYRSFVEQSSEGIWRMELSEPIDPALPEEEQLRLVFERAYLAECNDAMARMYGFESARDLVGCKLGDLLAEHDLRNIEFLRTFLHNGYRCTEIESFETDREGRPRYFINNMVGLKENGLLVRGWGMQRDITERRLAEEARQASEGYLRQVLDLVPHFIFAKDKSGRFILVNEAVAQAYGTTVDELTGKTDADFNKNPEEVSHFLSDDEDVIRSNSPKQITEEQITDYTGQVRLLQTTKIPFVFEGQPALLGIAIDITERKKAEAALRESEESYRRLVELAQESIVTVNEEDIITFCNPAFEQALGYSRAELIGRQLSDFCDEHSKLAIARGSTLRRQGITSTYELSMLSKSNERKTFIVAANPLLNSRGEFEGALGVMTDVTERIRAEQALAYAQKLESLGVLAGGIAHDFNNLLVGVMGNAGLALRDLPPASPVRRYILDIEMASQRAADLTRQMLAYSGKGQLAVQLLDISQTVEEISRLLEAAIPRNVALKFKLAQNLPAVEADAVQVRQVAMNLILNAAEAIGEASGIVSVTTGAVDADRDYLATAYLQEEPAEGLYIFLEVSDTGCGMDAATRARIFDPFFTTKFTGRGLGLAAVLGIVRAHRGSIKVYSEPGQGSTFKVLLPASASYVSTQHTAPRAPEIWRGSGTVLVVDDEPTVRAVAKRVLEHQGFTVLTAADGAEGLEQYRQQHGAITLVLLDMTMPKMNGDEAFREMRRIEPKVRVVLSSGYNEADATTRFAGKGLAGFLQKPYSPFELLAKVREILEPPAPSEQVMQQSHSEGAN